jgi:hypothetical protein
MARIYLASSWKNVDAIAKTVSALRDDNHQVYDFTNPNSGPWQVDGFKWQQISKDYKEWTFKEYTRTLYTNPEVRSAYLRDKAALDWCDYCILQMPGGRSAHLELGYCSGRGKKTIIYYPTDISLDDYDLMYLMCDALICTQHQLVNYLQAEKR